MRYIFVIILILISGASLGQDKCQYETSKFDSVYLSIKISTDYEGGYQYFNIYSSDSLLIINVNSIHKTETFQMNCTVSNYNTVLKYIVKKSFNCSYHSKQEPIIGLNYMLTLFRGQTRTTYEGVIASKESIYADVMEMVKKNNQGSSTQHQFNDDYLFNKIYLKVPPIPE